MKDPRLQGVAERARRIVSGMCLQEAAGQTLMLRTPDRRPETMLNLIGEGFVGGIIVEGRLCGSWPTPKMLREELAEYYRRSKHPLLIATPSSRGLAESGVVFGGLYLPGLDKFAAVGSLGMIELREYVNGLEAAAVGAHMAGWIHADMAPTRQSAQRVEGCSYRAGITQTTAYCRSALAGARRAGVAVCGCHWIGYVNVNPRFSLYEHNDELQPWRALIADGLDAVILTFTKTDLDPNRWVCQSKFNINYLREEMGFDGLLIADAFELPGSTSKGEVEYARACLAAGCDMVLPSHALNLRAFIEPFMSAVQSGQIPEERLYEAAWHVMTYKLRNEIDRKCRPEWIAEAHARFQAAGDDIKRVLALHLEVT